MLAEASLGRTRDTAVEVCHCSIIDATRRQCCLLELSLSCKCECRSETSFLRQAASNTSSRNTASR